MRGRSPCGSTAPLPTSPTASSTRSWHNPLDDSPAEPSAVETDAEGGQATLDRVRGALRAEGIQAAAGLGVRAAGGTLTAAWQEADRAMYADKGQPGGGAR